MGCGTMGEALVSGLLRAGLLPPERVFATRRRKEMAERLQERLGISVGTDNVEAASRASIVVLAVKPQEIRGIVDRDEMRRHLAGKTVISIAAGVRLSRLAEWLPESHLIRAMPNTPALIGEGMTVIARAPGVSDERMAIARRFFESVGRCIELEDGLMDAVTSLNGSGPAFVYVFLEALSDGGVRMGLRRDAAMEIAAQMMQGAAKMVLETGMHPAALKDQVTTPAGSTIAGLLAMEDGGVRSVVARAVEEAAKTAADLG